MSVDEHFKELCIAQSISDPRRVMPTVSPQCRSVLDVGCGAGQTLIASRLSSSVVAIGVDKDLSALTVGKQLTRSIHFVCSSGEQLPFIDGYFDLVVSRVAVPYMEIPRAMAEMARVMSPSGHLWIVLHPLSMVWRELLRSFYKLNLAGSLGRLFVIANGLAFQIAGVLFRLPFGSRSCESFQTSKSIFRTLKTVGLDDIKISKGRHFVVTARRRPSRNLPSVSPFDPNVSGGSSD